MSVLPQGTNDAFVAKPLMRPTSSSPAQQAGGTYDDYASAGP
jgi:hypothetical protein